jgi:hypothetical protein
MRELLGPKYLPKAPGARKTQNPKLKTQNRRFGELLGPKHLPKAPGATQNSKPKTQNPKPPLRRLYLPT